MSSNAPVVSEAPVAPVISLEGVGKTYKRLPNRPIGFGKRCGPAHFDLTAKLQMQRLTNLWPWRL